jgi:hypothetical protein
MCIYNWKGISGNQPIIEAIRQASRSKLKAPAMSAASQQETK